MLKLNKAQLKDKIHACWTGKNIGGTIGTPYEGTKEFLDVKGFASAKGEPLPNDDLDLQLVWLCAMEEIGPYQLNANDLATYWLAYIPPYWNEYGIGKSNMAGGLVPPLSGQCNNKRWYHSNGAWIRSEIWACLAPGFPKIARRYAFADACVDHGMEEGTVAELFTVTLESLAFYNNDLRAIIEEALEAIPAQSRVAKAVRYVIEAYDRGDDYKDVRDALVKQSEDIGWFQAPANIGFVTIGLLYGEGDFKKSILYAVNCGDDTDCTGGTVGAVLGILNGTAGIPADWAEYIGDRIITCSVNNGYPRVRKISTCSILTDRVMQLIPTVFLANDLPMEYTDGENHFEEAQKHFLSVNSKKRRYTHESEPLTLPKYNFEAYRSALLYVRASFDKEPILSIGDEIKVKLTIFNNVASPLQADLRFILPEGIDATTKYARLYITHQRNMGTDAEFTFTANEALKPFNGIIVEADIIGYPEPVLFRIPILGK